MKKQFILLVALFLISSNALANKLKIHVINVGHGQSVLIEGVNGKTILYDAGLPYKGDEVIAYIESQNITMLDYFILSHNHNDHGGGAQHIVPKFLPKVSYFSGSNENTQTSFMQKWFESYYGKEIPGPIGMPLGVPIDLGDGATATPIAVNGKIYNSSLVLEYMRENIDANYVIPDSDHINDTSVVLLIKYKGFDYLVSGDLGGHEHNSQADFETPVIVSALVSGESNVKTELGTIDILHVGHHGSQTSTNARYLDIAKPEYAIVSVGPNQSHGLPRKSVMKDSLIDRGIVALQTDEGKLSDSRTDTSGYVIGHIRIETDGLTYDIYGDESSIDRSKASQLNVVSEAAQAGLPVIARAVDEFAEVIENPVLAPPTLGVDYLVSDEVTLTIRVKDEKGLKQLNILVDERLFFEHKFDSSLSKDFVKVINRADYSAVKHTIKISVTDSDNLTVHADVIEFIGTKVEQPEYIEVVESGSNESYEHAQAIPNNAVKLRGYFPYYSDDYDWYSIVVAAGESVDFVMTGPYDYDQDYDIYLYSESGELLLYSENWGTQEQFTFTNYSSYSNQKVYLLVARYFGYSRNHPYEISISRH